MNTFPSIKALTRTLDREEKLLAEMFAKRDQISYEYEYALQMVDYQEARLENLVKHNIIIHSGDYLEMDTFFIEFFEELLTTKEEVNTAAIDTYLSKVKENIRYYFAENKTREKARYLRDVKVALRRIGYVTIQNVIRLSRSLETTYKNEKSYKVKKVKLQVLDEKHTTINSFIDRTHDLLDEDERTFFKTAADDELNQTILQLKQQLNECSLHLIDIRQQIIDYLNQLEQQNAIIEKIRRIKYLKDQFTLRAETNIDEILNNSSDVIFEKQQTQPLKLSLDLLQTDDEVHATILRLTAGRNKKSMTRQKIADPLPEELLAIQEEVDIQINMEEVRNNFQASGNDLFNFLQSYRFEKTLTFDEKVTIYCQMISLFDEEFKITDQYDTCDEIEYAIVYPQ